MHYLGYFTWKGAGCTILEGCVGSFFLLLFLVYEILFWRAGTGVHSVNLVFIFFYSMGSFFGNVLLGVGI